MKILIVRTIAKALSVKKTYNVQGIGLGTALSKLGHHVALVYYAADGKDKEQIIPLEGNSLKIYHISGHSFLKNAIYATKLYELCKEYDIIQPSEYDQIATWMIYKKFPEKTIIYHGPYASKFTKKHNFFVKVFDALFLRRIQYRNACVISKSILAENYLKTKGFKKIVTLGVGLNPEYIDREEKDIPNIITNLQQIKKNRKYLLYVGAISERKNVKFILQVLNSLKKSNNEILLLIVGPLNQDDTYYKQCIEYIDKNNLNENVIFCGETEQKYLKHYYQMSDVFLFPTQYDIFGMVYLEAMYFGVPVVTTLCGGSATLIEDGVSGFVRDLGNVEEWSNTIEGIISDPSQYIKMSKKEMDIVKNEFLWSKLAVKFETEYKKLLNDIG